MENEITPEMTEDYNRRSRKYQNATDAQRAEVKLDYFRHMHVPTTYRSGDYDTKLVECDSNGKIVDNNNVMLTVRVSMIMWGAILIVALITFALASIFGPSGFLSVIIMLTAVGILVAIFYSLYNCIKKLTSKRDRDFKLRSLLEILPLIIIPPAICLLFGAEVLAGSIVMLVFCGIMGAILLIILKILF